MGSVEGSGNAHLIGAFSWEERSSRQAESTSGDAAETAETTRAAIRRRTDEWPALARTAGLLYNCMNEETLL